MDLVGKATLLELAVGLCAILLAHDMRRDEQHTAQHVGKADYHQDPPAYPGRAVARGPGSERGAHLPWRRPKASCRRGGS